MDWIRRVHIDYPEVYRNAKIDVVNTGVINKFNDPTLVYHMEHPAFSYYPIVGISWNQTHDYLSWRTDRFNEDILIKLGLEEPNFKSQMMENNFNTESYLYGQYSGLGGKGEIIEEASEGKSTRTILWKDGILTPQYRLPTEAEWMLLKDENEEKEIIISYPYGKSYAPLRWMRKYVESEGEDYNLLALRDYELLWKENGIPNPLNYPNYKNGIQGPYLNKEKNSPSNVAGNVREWLLDYYQETPQISWTSLELHMEDNGYIVKENKIPRLYDAYGVYNEKDSLGKMMFRIYGSRIDGTPFIASQRIRNTTNVFIGYDTIKRRFSKERLIYDFDSFYSIYANDSRDLYEYFKWNRYDLNNFRESHVFYYLKPVFMTNWKIRNNLSFNYSSNDTMREVVKKWIKTQWDYKKEKGFAYYDGEAQRFFYGDERGPYSRTLIPKVVTLPIKKQKINRVVRGGTWKDPDFSHRESVHPDSARTDIGFRVLLPYSGTPILKEYKVKWD